MVAWLNQNAGAVMAVLTLVYVVATLALVLLNWWNLRVLRELDRRRSQPYVVFDLVGKHHAIHAVVRNAGLTAAKDVRIQTTPQLERGNRTSPLTTQGVAYLAPGREFWDFIEGGPAFFQRYVPPRFSGRVSYKDTDGHEYDEPFTIDLEFQRTLMSVPIPDVAEELKKVREAIEKKK